MPIFTGRTHRPFAVSLCTPITCIIFAESTADPGACRTLLALVAPGRRTLRGAPPGAGGFPPVRRPNSQRPVGVIRRSPRSEHPTYYTYATEPQTLTSRRPTGRRRGAKWHPPCQHSMAFPLVFRASVDVDTVDMFENWHRRKPLGRVFGRMSISTLLLLFKRRVRSGVSNESGEARR